MLDSRRFHLICMRRKNAEYLEEQFCQENRKGHQDGALWRWDLLLVLASRLAVASRVPAPEM